MYMEGGNIVEPLLKDTPQQRTSYAIKDTYQSPEYHATAIFYP